MTLHFSIIFLTIYLLNQLGTSDAVSWDECGQKDDALQINSFTLTPDPIRNEKRISIGWNATVKDTITELRTKTQFYKKSGSWKKVQCLPIYQCDIDVCQSQRNHTGCTLQKGATIRTTTHANPSNVPGGHYYGEINYYSGTKRVGCIRVYFAVYKG